MKKPLLLGLLALLLVPTTLASAQSDNAYTAYDRKDVAALTRMAEAGDPVAQYNLGVMYGEGDGVRQDHKEAVRLYRLSAAQGDADAQYNLGVSYDKGLGVTQDYKEAVRLYRLSAAQGKAMAQYNLGVAYRNGQGVTQDYKEAVRLYRLSAAQGNANAQSNLGTMYFKGLGVTQDYKEAVRLFRLAAARGSLEGQYNLGLMYGNGQGVIQDNVYSYMWFNVAAESGDAAALKNMGIIAGTMTAVDISKAKELARECVRKNYKGCDGDLPPVVMTMATPPTIRTVSAPPSASTKITLSSNGKTILVSGDIERGSADRFKILLDAAPSVENVALVSSGGNLDEATEMYQAIKTRGLDTYVDQYCMSACTMVFLGGQDRSATPQAKIGFHKPFLMADKPLQDAAVEAKMRRFYDEANVRPSFTDKSMSTPSSSMWYPSFDELLASNVVTTRTLGGQVSAFANIYKKRADYENEFLKSNFGSLLKTKHPDVFAEIVDAAWTAQQEGKTDGEVGNAMRAKMTEKYSIILASADDAVFDRYIRLVLAQLKAVREISFEACSLLNQGKLDITKNLPLDFVTEEFALLEAALKSKQKISVITEKQVEEFWPDIFADMTDVEIQAISDPANSNPIDVCNSAVKMYSAIEKMPMTDRVLVARYLILSE